MPPLAPLALSLVESNVVALILLGRRLEINTVSQLITMAFWTWLWGVPGAILAVRVLVVAKVVCDNVKNLQTLGSFLAGDPGTKANEPPQRATTGPVLELAPLPMQQAEAREDFPPTQAPSGCAFTPPVAE